MGMIAKLFGEMGGSAAGEAVKGAGEAVNAVAGGISDLAMGIRRAITGEMSEATRIELEKLAQQSEERGKELMLAQTSINAIEASHASLFVSGARPFILWVCGLSLALFYIPQFVLAAIFWTKLCWASGAIVAYPASPDSLMELTFGMLGMATIRTVEKLAGKARN